MQPTAPLRRNLLPQPFARALLGGILLLAPGLLAGCVEGGALCDPDWLDTETSLHLVDADARPLPILTSGATTVADYAPTAHADATAPGLGGPVNANVDPGIRGSILDQPLPDSHGRLAFRIDIRPDNVTSLDITQLRLEIVTGGAPIPVKILRVEGGDRWIDADDDGQSWEGRALNGGDLALWWAVDGDRLDEVARTALAVGDPYSANVTFHWEFRNCREWSEDNAHGTFQDIVRVLHDEASFDIEEPPRFDETDTGYAMRTALRLVGDADTRIESIRGICIIPPTPDNPNAGGIIVLPNLDLNVTEDGRRIVATTLDDARGIPLPPDVDVTTEAYVVLDITVQVGDAGATVEERLVASVGA